MHCMKCGREMESEQVFCEDCLLDMEKYPVPPDAKVHLPPRRRESPGSRKQNRRRKLTAEEKVPILQKRIHILATALAIVMLLLAACIYPAANYFIRHYNLQPGQNYTTITTDHSQPADAD